MNTFSFSLFYRRFYGIDLSNICINENLKYKFINFIEFDSSIKERYMLAIRFLKSGLFNNNLNDCIFINEHIRNLIKNLNIRFNKNYSLENLSMFLCNGVYPIGIEPVEFYRYLIYTSIDGVVVFYTLYLYDRYIKLNIRKIIDENIDLGTYMNCCILSNKDFIESLYNDNILLGGLQNV